MLRLTGVILLVGGSAGVGWSLREKIKENLDSLYLMRQIIRMLQNEITYSMAPLPEACLRIGNRIKEPYRSAFLAIHREMLSNGGASFAAIWKMHMGSCLKKTGVSGADRKVFLDFGDCIGYMDGKMQAQAMERYGHQLDVSVERLEKEMVNRCRVIMSLSVTGGALLAILLI